jgi:hypothetical protein
MYHSTDRQCRVFENIDHRNAAFSTIELLFEYFEWLPLPPVIKLNTKIQSIVHKPFQHLQ